VAYLFDTDVIVEVMQPDPDQRFLNWLRDIPREDQFISAISLSEIFYGALSVPRRQRHLDNIEKRLLTSITVLPFDTAIAREFSTIRISLELTDIRLSDADLQVVATAIYHGLKLVSGKPEQFRRIRGLQLENILGRTTK
jgi:predicted nucleic acid-binding protein